MKEFKRIKKDNRNTSLESLYYVVVLLTTDDQAVFKYAYKKATHDDSGDSIWYHIHKGHEEFNAYQRKRYALNKGKK